MRISPVSPPTVEMKLDIAVTEEAGLCSVMPLLLATFYLKSLLMA